MWPVLFCAAGLTAWCILWPASSPAALIHRSHAPVVPPDWTAPIEAGMGFPAELPRDLLLYPGSVQEDQQEGPGWERAVYSSLDQVSRVLAYYREKLSAAGWSIQVGGHSGIKKTISFNGQGCEGTITIGAYGDGASITIEIKSP